MEALKETLAALAEKTAKNNRWRQNRCFNLIPSETTPSLLVKVFEISDPAGRYAEHRTMKGKEIYFYQGTDFIRDVEIEAAARLAEYFECSEVEVRPISGQMANEIVFKAMTKNANRENQPGETFRRLRSVMNNDLTKGGHLSSQPMGALFNYVEIDPATGKESVVNFPVRKDNPYRADTARLAELLETHKPELVVFGKSMFIYPEPVGQVAEIARDMDPRPVLMYDMAHVLGLYGAFQKPLAEGADLVTGSTHKTFFGPQRGVIASNLDKKNPLRKLWLDIKSRAFPGSTSNHHLGTLLGLLAATCEMNTFREAYQQQVRKNAKAFAKALKATGLDVEGDPQDGYTETHQVLVRVSKYGTGEEAAKLLEDNNIVVNYQALPDDESFINSSGIRTGVQEMTRFGMKEKDFEKLAGFIADVLIKKRSIAEEVSAYRQNFLEMQYCLPAADSLEIASRVIASVFPSSENAGRFAERLAEAAAKL